MACLLQEPLHYAGGVVAVRHVVAQGREAVGLATLLHFGELFQIELLILDCAPIVFGVIHREARSEGAVGADDEPVLTGAATPVFAYTAHEALHILQARNGINHFVALALLVNQSVEQIVIDAQDFGIAKISGHPASKLSFWINRAEFVRQFQRIDGFWLPYRDETIVDIRVHGRREFRIEHEQYVINATDDVRPQQQE